MNRRVMGRPALLLFLSCILFGMHMTAGAQGQSDQLEIHLVYPNEGETFYAGPGSLLYSLPVKGYVTGMATADLITVQLQVLQQEQVISTVIKKADVDGTFTFRATVNPGASAGQFPAEQGGCEQGCHSPGDLDLPQGTMTFHVTALSSDGQQRVSVSRTIRVDRAEQMVVPVQVILDDETRKPVAGIKVSASTWIYLWRSRFGSGVTDNSGQATVQVEALSLAPTDYVLRVSPTIVDGVLYRGVDSVALTLPPGARKGSPISLAVTAHRAQLSGSVKGITGPSAERLTAYAICLPDGQAFSTDVGKEGQFTFTNLPVDQYHVTLGGGELAAPGRVAARELDLTEDLDADVILEMQDVPGTVLEGEVQDGDGTLLPFAWATTEQPSLSSATLPATGCFRLAGPLAERATLVVNAPGYYAQASVIDPAQDSAAAVKLRAQPETTRLPWGDGEIILPREGELDRSDNRISLKYGWLWGQGSSSQPWQIDTPEANITINDGRFALEYLPGRRAWFYLFEGEATLSTSLAGENLIVSSGQMVNLINEEGLKAVTYDPVVVRALRRDQDSPVPLVWEPGLSAQIRDRLARIGIGAAQVVTFVTYLLILTSLLAAPLLLLYFVYKRRRTPQSPD